MSFADELREKHAREKGSTDAQIQKDAEDARFIAARLPEFWASLKEAASIEVGKINESAPSDYRCEFLPQDSFFCIRRASFPFRAVECRLNLDGRVLHIRKAEDLDTLGHLEHPAKEDLAVRAESGSLAFYVAGKAYRTPVDIIDYFLRFVCKP